MKWWTCFLIAWPCIGAAQDLPARLDAIRREQDLPAMGVVVFDQNKILTQAVTGVRRRGGTSQVKTEDRWHLGSITKSMTGSLAAILVEEKRIQWDRTVAEAFGKVHEGFRNVTLHQLMEHRAGISHDGPREIWRAFTQKTGTSRATRSWWVQEIFQQAPELKVGGYEYSNPGIAAAGKMLELATDKPWESLMEEKLFRPLGLSSAGFGMPARPAKEDQPWGHRSNGTAVPPGPHADNPAGLGPAGTVHMSLQDLATYGRWHLSRGKSHPGILSRKSIEWLHTPRYPAQQGGAYACGWVIVQRPWAGGTAITHSGSNNMNFAVLWLAPERKFGFAVVCNQGGDKASAATDQMAAAVVKWREANPAQD
jgi:CubicO group peptidase (beta-lactamase class C family)